MGVGRRAAVAERPGARVLNIVGSSHKPFYDAYLDLMPDVTLVDVEAVLKWGAARLWSSPSLRPLAAN
jgi:hypothetical protein